jgi:hypothetical protein
VSAIREQLRKLSHIEGAQKVVQKSRPPFRDIAAGETIEGGEIEPGLRVVDVPDDTARRVSSNSPKDAQPVVTVENLIPPPHSGAGGQSAARTSPFARHADAAS